MFLLPHINLKLRPAILKLKPGTRIVSNSFDMREWAPDQTVDVSAGEGCDNTYCEAYLWIVPATVQGQWKLPQGTLTLRQTFQTIAGTFKAGAKAVTIAKGKVRGDQISFDLGDDHYSGRVSGNIMKGTFKNVKGTFNWQASQVGGMVQRPSQ